jgi:hypothetical protein
MNASLVMLQLPERSFMEVSDPTRLRMTTPFGSALANRGIPQQLAYCAAKRAICALSPS